jgi:hypothetical protein
MEAESQEFASQTVCLQTIDPIQKQYLLRQEENTLSQQIPEFEQSIEINNLVNQLMATDQITILRMEWKPGNKENANKENVNTGYKIPGPERTAFKEKWKHPYGGLRPSK